uniref:GG22006 n=1 Tax=Drosophila erecta TaxID=7220 RepID=B3P3H7_DROER
MAQALVDEETLEALVFERSKAWSSKMKEFTSLEDGMEMNVSEFDNLFHGEDQNPDLEDVALEALEDNVPKEAKLEMGHINATSVAELTLVLCANENEESKTEIEEILNETVPVVEEHKRKWREAGLDRILDTFDEKQIEHHVGRWMRRHNGVYLEASPPKYHHAHHNSISDESDESMHSIDTARYIQQSRRRNVHTNNKTSHMSTIKMYRKHSHKRDELRAKYAYDDEQEHRHHMQAVLLRRRERERQLAYLASRPMECVYSRGHYMRRKYLRKRRINSWMFDSASSSEDDTSFGGGDCLSCRRHYSQSRSVYKSSPYGKYRHPQVASRTMRTVHRHHTFDMELDLRPRLPENECSCCNSNRLCSNVIHIANSSTEEWVVENRGGHLTQETQDMPRKQEHQPMDAKKISHRSKEHEQTPHSSKATSASKMALSTKNYMQMFPNETSDEDNAVTKKVLTPKTSEQVREEESDLSSDLKTRSSTTTSILGLNDNETSNSDEDFQQALALSKASFKEEILKRRKENTKTSNNQSQSTAEESMPIFNNQSVVCNSTAMANDTACRRLLRNRRGVKRAAAVSSTEENAATSSLSSSTSSLGEMNCPTLGDPDCTVVTSTTCESPASEPVPFPATIRITERGILLHRPSASGGANFTLTEQGLGKIIGERWARKYLKYHIGSRSFDSRHSVYYKPTPQLAAVLRSPQDAQNLGNSSASDDDIFEQVNRYGTVYSILENNSGDN